MNLPSIVLLRALASLGVCGFHLMAVLTFVPNWLRTIMQDGWLGVHVFFIVSGFIIPWSLYQHDFKIKNYPLFLIKRIIRLDPPYIVATILLIAVGFLGNLHPDFKGEPFSVSPAQFLFHFAYLNNFTNYPWLNSVYWSLAIEFQYYLLMGLFFFLFIQKSVWNRVVTNILLFVLFVQFRGDTKFILAYIPLFLVGISTFQRKMGLIGKLEYLFYLIPSAIASSIYSPKMPVIAVVTALIIFFFNYSFKITNFMGNISYSLYLLHKPIGIKVVHLAERYIRTTAGEPICFLLGCAASIFAAYLLYKYVEAPSQQWSKKISYTKTLKEEFKNDKKTYSFA